MAALSHRKSRPGAQSTPYCYHAAESESLVQDNRAQWAVTSAFATLEDEPMSSGNLPCCENTALLYLTFWTTDRGPGSGCRPTLGANGAHLVVRAQIYAEGHCCRGLWSASRLR